MYAKLSEKEAAELLRFRYTPILEQESSATPISSLVLKKQMKTFLEEVKVDIQAPDLKVAASVFMKRYAFVVVIYLYALSSWNKRLHFTLDSLYLQNSEMEGNWLPEYYFENLSLEKFTGENRDHWRNQAIQHLFKDIMFPILNSLTEEAKISKYILWENIAVYLHWLYEKVLDHEQGSLAFEDYDYIVNHAPGKVFGPYERNPLERFTAEPVYLSQLKETIRIRKTCCFTYQLGAKRTYCNTCPLYCKQFNTGKRN
ncbi:MAG: IucA/IucC family C-terminal-domain containing protein [Bacillota bacterium]